MTSNVCEGCVYADWERTSNGSLHPNKAGRCTWGVSVPMAAAYRGAFNSPRTNPDGLCALGFDGIRSAAFIERGLNGYKNCPTRKTEHEKI